MELKFSPKYNLHHYNMLIMISIFMPLFVQDLKLEDSAYYSEDHLLYHNHFAAMGTRLTTDEQVSKGQPGMDGQPAGRKEILTIG
jgi:hypothetical protein